MQADGAEALRAFVEHLTETVFESLFARRLAAALKPVLQPTERDSMSNSWHAHFDLKLCHLIRAESLVASLCGRLYCNGGGFIERFRHDVHGVPDAIRVEEADCARRRLTSICLRKKRASHRLWLMISPPETVMWCASAVVAEKSPYHELAKTLPGPEQAGLRACGVPMDGTSLFPGSVVYCWHAGKHAAVVQDSLERSGFEIRSQIIWAKNRFALSRGNYHWQHEPCWYAVKNGGDARWGGDRSQSTLWQIQEPGYQSRHPEAR